MRDSAGPEHEVVNRWSRGALVVLVFGIWCAGGVYAREFSLQFSLSIYGSSTIVVPDNFHAAASDDPCTLPGFDRKDLRKQPPLPGSYVLLEDSQTGISLIRDCRPFNPAATSLYYVVDLIAYDAGGTGLSGTSILKLVNPDGLDAIPADTMVYVRLYDAAGVFVHRYDMRDPAEQTISWPVENVNGRYAIMELVILSECLAANPDNQGLSDFRDFGIVAQQWRQPGTSSAADINGDHLVDFKDLMILARHWLYQCP
jgi:hypothetical protein